jgi:hypothetical protein
VLLTRAPLYSRAEAHFLARLACVRHAASVQSEPGSNSPVRKADLKLTNPEGFMFISVCFLTTRYLIVKDLLPASRRETEATCFRSACQSPCGFSLVSVWTRAFVFVQREECFLVALAPFVNSFQRLFFRLVSSRNRLLGKAGQEQSLCQPLATSRGRTGYLGPLPCAVNPPASIFFPEPPCGRL